MLVNIITNHDMSWLTCQNMWIFLNFIEKNFLHLEEVGQRGKRNFNTPFLWNT